MIMDKVKSLLSKCFGKRHVSNDEYEQVKNALSPQPDLDIRFTDSRRIIMAGLIVVGLFFGVGGLWVTFAELTGAVIANGEVRVDSERKTVQHLEGGIVRKILVRNGDQVEAGQPLLLLDSTQVGAATDHTLLQFAAAKIVEARLLAEIELAATPSWPQQDGSIPEKKFAEMLSSERKVFTSGRGALENQNALLNKQIQQLHEQINSLDDRLAAGALVTETLQEELDAKLVLYQDHYIDKTRILELRRALADRQGSLAQLRGSQAELRERVAEYGLRIHALESEYRQKSINLLAEKQKEIFSLQQQLLPLQDARRRQVVTAPVSGEVVAMEVHSEGGVIKPGQAILDIVPEDSPLIVEVRIQVSDVTYVFPDQEADVQLLAFPSRSTPKVAGKVVYVSADRIMQRTAYGEQPSFIVHVELNRQELVENSLYLTAGMPAAVFIRTKPRTVLDYIIEPLKENFDRAMRDK
ncbi:MAG: HlyD family type I secretion periplasmic adaptor subunit [Desulfuromonadales bacterium]|nr:HlyD family type I secretion periplasmic adaptor subunit [Desulfuromonadales bacterium]